MCTLYRRFMSRRPVLGKHLCVMVWLTYRAGPAEIIIYRLESSRRWRRVEVNDERAVMNPLLAITQMQPIFVIR